MKHAPIPMEALRDPELSATDFRILGAIASHDRLSRNGRGCFASMGTLAREALCGLRSAERSVGRLKDRGYVRGERSRADGRQYVLRVVYLEDDEIPAKSGGNLARDTRQPDPNYPPTQFEVREQDQGLGKGKHSSKHILGTAEANAAEAAPFLRNDADILDFYAPHIKDDNTIGRYLRLIQDNMKRMLPGERHEHATVLFHLEDRLEFGTALYHWSLRLMSELEWLNSEAA